jgi:adenine phosphoribosyltransferase
LLRDPEAYSSALKAMTAFVKDVRPDCIGAIEARGFLFAAPIATALSLPLVPIRKEGKLPAARASVDYALEYGTGQLEVHSDSFVTGARVAIVDDLTATGGTAYAAARLIESLGGEVVGLAFLIELAGLGGRERLHGRNVYALMTLS